MDLTFYFSSNLDIYIKIKILNFMEWKMIKMLCWLDLDIRKIVSNIKYWTFNFSRIFGKDRLPTGILTSKKIYKSIKKVARCQYDNSPYSSCRQYISTFTDPMIYHSDANKYCRVHLSPFCQYHYVRGSKKGTKCQDLVYKAIRSKLTLKGDEEYCWTHIQTKSVRIILDQRIKK